MKLRLTALLLIVVCLCAGCGMQSRGSARGKTYGYFCYDGMDWGVSEEEWERSCNPPADSSTAAEGINAYTLDTTFLKVPAEATLTFWNVPLTETYVLTAVRLQCRITAAEFPDFVRSVETYLDAQKVKYRVEKSRQKQLADGTVVDGVAGNYDDVDAVSQTQCIRYDSTADLLSLPQKILDHCDAYIDTLYAQGFYPDTGLRKSDMKSINGPLSTLQITAVESDTEFTCDVLFSGQLAAMAFAYNDLA